MQRFYRTNPTQQSSLTRQVQMTQYDPVYANGNGNGNNTNINGNVAKNGKGNVSVRGNGSFQKNSNSNRNITANPNISRSGFDQGNTSNSIDTGYYRNNFGPISVPNIGGVNRSKDKYQHIYQFQDRTRQLERSLSKQQGQLTKNLHLMGRNKSKASLAQSATKKSHKKLQNTDQSNINQIIQAQYAPGQAQGQGRLTLLQTTPTSSSKFTFSPIQYLITICLSYGLFISLLYLTQALSNFPIFLILFTLCLPSSIYPWSSTNLLIPIALIPIIITNRVLNIGVLSLPSIAICYLSVMIFNQRYKRKLLWLPTIVTVVVWGFALLPAVLLGLMERDRTNALAVFYYIFPIFVVIGKTVMNVLYGIIGFSQEVYLQVGFFWVGLEYGVMLTLGIGSVEFWYLMVWFTLGIVNDRTGFLVKLVKNMGTAFRKIGHSGRHKNRKQKQKQKQANRQSQILNSQPKKPSTSSLSYPSQPPVQILNPSLPALPAHSSGHICIHSFHLICLVYILTKLPLATPPYTSSTTLSVYVTQSYLPLVIWALGCVYQGMCLILLWKRKDKLLIGFPNKSAIEDGERTGWARLRRVLIVGRRVMMLTCGFWIFYLGLGIGNYCVGEIWVGLAA